MLHIFLSLDIFFVEEKDSRRHTMFKDNTLLQIDPHGKIMLSERVTLELHCHMDFKLYPFDAQLCKVTLESMGMLCQA